jgi:DNA-binding IclR family transcriptional regulator
MLASLPNAELDEFLNNALLAAATPNTLTDPTLLRQHLLTVRTRGYALDQEEASLGVWCVAAPVRDYTGRTVAAISVSMYQRPDADRLQELIRLVGARAGRISAAAGHPAAGVGAHMELAVRQRT